MWLVEKANEVALTRPTVGLRAVPACSWPVNGSTHQVRMTCRIHGWVCFDIKLGRLRPKHTLHTCAGMSVYI